MFRLKRFLGLVSIAIMGGIFLINQCCVNTDMAIGARAVSYTRLGVGTGGYAFNDTGNFTFNGANFTLGTSDGIEEGASNTPVEHHTVRTQPFKKNSW
jgi:hypothetical protein